MVLQRLDLFFVWTGRVLNQLPLPADTMPAIQQEGNKEQIRSGRDSEDTYANGGGRTVAQKSPISSSSEKGL